MKTLRIGFRVVVAMIGMFGLMLTVVAHAGAPFTLTSPAFQHNQSIPGQYTCKGANVNPPFVIAGIPEGTKTLALILDDPDAPRGTWVHWVVYNIPLTDQIKENSIPGVEGYNDFGSANYGGPCPPEGMHRYFFKLYALDQEIPAQKAMRKNKLEKAMKGHILAETNLIGLYRQ